MKHAIPAMLQHGGGAIVNISSTMGERAAAGDPSYPTSKHAVRGLTQSAALTYATLGVRVNSVGPGFYIPDFEYIYFTNWKSFSRRWKRVIPKQMYCLPLHNNANES
jgi:NAD(P)-dependent dehydrogenase (short-subunit alcohol dehydrogenase family)